MNLFTNFSRKGVAKRFVFLFLTLLTFGFTSEAQIPTFTEILEQYYNVENIVLTANRATPYGEQLENYDFESWENEGTSSVEPTQWNSFMTAETAASYLNSAKSQQINYSTEIRPNSSGSRSARVYAKEINLLIMKIIANGNMTNGKIYAGSTTANNDKNYNFTSRSDANFNTPITSIPDSLTVWVAFRANNAVNAKITTTIHGDTDLKQLAKSGNSPVDKVCATADVKIPRTSASGSAIVWKRVTIPFVKDSHNDPRYILVTFNTNETAGEGAKNDELFVDDACLIYNPVLGLELLAQTEYVYPSEGSSVNISIPFNLEGSMSVYNLNAAANEVIAQLSDANGSFANPTELGRMTTDVSGTINGVIPAGLPEGTGYRVRVVSTNYPMISEDNGTDIIIRNYDPKVEIALGNVATKSATATFTPNADCAEYYFLIAKASESVNAAYVKANGEKQTSAYTKTFEGLTSNTAYVVYALPVGAGGDNVELKTLNVKTEAFNPQLEIVLGNVATKSITATFTPNADCAEYYFLITKASESVNAAYVKANGEKKNAKYTKTWEGLTSNTSYVVYVLTIDAEGNNGALKTVNVTTVAFNPQVEITRGNVAAKSIIATFTPNADCAEYYFLIATASETVDAAYVKANGEKQTATFTKTFENLTSNTDYVIYALPVDVDGFNGNVKNVTIKTNALVPQVEIAKGEVTTKSITATFTPNADCAEYYFLIAKASESVNAAYVKANGEKQTSAYTKTWESLVSNTDYVVYALPIDVEGNNGALKTFNVTTVAFNPQVEIARGNVAAKSITATFTPNAECVEYYFLIAESSETVDAAYVRAEGEKQDAEYTKKFEDLTSNTEYVIYALPVDVDGFNGTVKTVTIKTNALVPQVEIVKGEVATYSFEVNFTPNTDCSKYYFVLSTESVDADYIMANGEERTGNISQLWEGLLPSTGYTVYVLPIDIEGNAGAVNTLTVKTKVEAGVSEVDIDIVKLSDTSVEITATPNENTILYHYIVLTKEDADAMGEDALMQELDANENYLTAVEVETMTVESNVAYYVVAQGKNADDKWGEVTKVEFTVSGPAAVEILVEKLTETSVEVTATPNENTASYRYIVIEKAEADAMDTDALMQKLGEANELNAVDVWTWTVKSDVEYYVIAQGKNTDGRLGEVTKVEFVVAGVSTVAIAVEELSDTSVEITATPNENTVSYHYIVIEKAEADAMDADALMQKLNENEDYLEGVNAEELTIESNVAYYVLAQGKNADDKWGTVTKVEFIVEVAGPAVVEISVIELSDTSVEVTATPNENTVSYKYIVIKKAEADAMDADALMQKLEEANELNAVDVWTWTIESNVEYYVIAQGKNADDIWGEMTKVEFVVEVAGPAVVEIEVEEISSSSVSITATPNENTVAYHYIVIEKAEADAMETDALMQRLAENDDYLEGVNTKEMTIDANVAYYVVAQGKNADDKWGTVTKVEFVVIDDAVSELDETMFEIYPNPASEYVKISSNNMIDEIMIFSIDGRMVYSEDVDNNETSIDVSSFESGAYIMKMVVGKEVVVKRVIFN